MSQFIVIEKHGRWDYAIIATNEDGTNKVFTSSEDAYKEAEECQDGIVIGDIDDQTERVYTKKQLLEFKSKLKEIARGSNLLDQYNKFFELD